VTDGTPLLPEAADEGGGSFARVSASVIDQALSTATNFLLTLLAAKLLGTGDFGAFSVAYLVAVAIVGSARAGVGSPALVLQRHATRDNAAGPLGSALTTGLVSGGVVALAALACTAHVRPVMLALAVVLPGILVQDTGRLVAFAELLPSRALVLDVIWTIAMIVGLVAAAVLDVRETPATLVLIWGGAGTLSALWSLWTHGRRIPKPTITWLQHSWHFAWRYFVVFATTLGAFQVSALLLGVVSGVAAVGAVQAVQVLFGPLQNLATGLMNAFVPETTEDTPLRELRSRVIACSVALTTIALTIMVVGLVVPKELGEAFLGDSWEHARSLLVPAGLGAAMFGVCSGPVIGLRAARAVHETLVVGVQIATFQVVVPVLGAVVDDQRGFMWALVGTWIAGSVLWLRCYRSIESGTPVRPTPVPSYDSD
jgi:O-antigen/teichoic acid export membrane protein